MYEFDSVSVSSYEASTLAAKLTEKSNDGWEIVSIVSAGSDVVAFLKRSGSGSGSAAAATGASTSETSGATRVGADAGDSSETSEPAGWGTAPAAESTSGWDSSSRSPSGETTAASTPPGSGAATWGGSAGSESGGGTWGGSSGSAPDAGSGWGSGGGQPQSTPTAPASSQPATPAVPPGWYADPAGRYELRYWDGSAWTEHVSRAGQQYTDPPVA